MRKCLSIILFLCLFLSGCGRGYEGEYATMQVLTSMESETYLEFPDFTSTHTILYRYEYDEYGRVVQEEQIVGGELAYADHFFWSGDGLERTEITIDHQGFLPWPESRVKEVYDGNGNVILRIVYQFWKETQRSIYTYDAAGNFIRLEINDADGSTTVQDYTYDENGNQLTTVSDSGDGVKRETRYSYDEAGNQTGWQYYVDGVLQEYVEYFYDNQGRPSFSARYDAGGVQQYYWEYSYSEAGDTVTTSFSGERTTTAFFDADGNLIRSERYEDDTLTGLTRYTYETIQVIPTT